MPGDLLARAAAEIIAAAEIVVGVDAAGCQGLVGCEHRRRNGMLAGLGWREAASVPIS